MPQAYRIIYGFILKLKVLYAKKLSSDKQKSAASLLKMSFGFFYLLNLVLTLFVGLKDFVLQIAKTET